MSKSTVLVCLTVAVSACASRPARTDVVLQWNQQVMVTGGPQIQRTLAMVHVAMFDAVNAIEPRYAPYSTLPAPPAGASAQAAAAGAAYGVLVRLFPEEQDLLSAALARSLADTQARIGLVSSEYFTTLGLDPILGRSFTADEDRFSGGQPSAAPSA